MTNFEWLKLVPVENELSCDYPLNPRFIWSSLKQLSSDDISYVYESTGLIRSSASVAQNDASDSMSAGVVLLPSKINVAFIVFPNVSFLANLAKLNIACIHREYIELLAGAANNYISVDFPHLIRCESLNLIESKAKLDLKHILIAMFTCLDLSSFSVLIRNLTSYYI